MRSVIKGIVAASLLAGTTVAAAAPAEAQRWHGGGHYRGYGGYHGGWHRGGVSTGTAVAAGLLGLGVGAAIASSDRGPGYYGGGYYAPPPPPPPPAYGYYYAPPPPPVYYGYGGYGW